MRVYIAGPMRGYEQYNFPAFDAARDMLIKLGHEPVNPADLDRAVGIDEYGTTLPEGFMYSALRRDLRAITDCNAIAFLPGWKASSGVAVERSAGEAIGLKLYDINPETSLFALQSEGFQLVGLSGYAQSGKDTIATTLVEDGWERVAFAGALRRSLYELNPQVVDDLFIGTFRLQHLINTRGWDKVKRDFPEVRQLLQRMGTDVGRQLLGDNVWVDIAVRKLEPGHKYVFTDVRFPNEAEAITRLGGQMWRVERPGKSPVNEHISEVALDDFNFDVTINNNADLGTLAAKARLAVAEGIPT